MRRVRRDRLHEELVQQLCESKTGFFNEIWRLLIFAALLGKKRGRRRPLADVDAGKSIEPKVFGNASSIWPGLLHLLGVIETGSPDCLKASQWEQSLLVFEEFANGGLELLAEEFHTSDFSITSFYEFLMTSEPEVDNGGQQEIRSLRI